MDADLRIDTALDKVLRAAGTRLRNYMPLTQDELRRAMREVMSAEYIAGSNACEAATEYAMTDQDDELERLRNALAQSVETVKRLLLENKAGAEVIDALRERAAHKSWTDDMDASVSELAGDQCDKAYSAGLDDGATLLARELLECCVPHNNQAHLRERSVAK